MTGVPWGTVTVDGVDLGEAPFQRELSPGPHEVRVTLPSHAVRKKRVVVESGRRTTWNLSLAAP